MNHYTILGIGNSAPNVIEDSLRDLPTPRTFHIITERTKSEGKSRVYDWLLDNNEAFVSYFVGDVPKILMSSAKHYYDCENENVMIDTIIDNAIENKSTILYLWDESDAAHCERTVISYIEKGLNVKDLTQGLVPFLIEGETKQQPKVDVPKESPVEKDELTAFTRADYETMPKWTIDAHAKAQGINTMRMSKEEAINALLYGEQVDESAHATVIIVCSDGSVRYTRLEESKALALL